MIKFHGWVLAGAVVTAVMVLAPGHATADSPAAELKAAEVGAAESELVEYRLVSWKTAHSDADKAEALVNALKKLRCEVEVAVHNGHTDVKYRSVKWQRISLKDHAAAHQWESWLKKHGFETKHTH
jgi:diphthamide synthase (EF-2-diphthine--ammonia ligase)